MCHHFRGDGLHLLVDTVDGSCDLGVLIGDILTLDQLGAEMSVRGNEELSDMGELRTCLCDNDFLAFEVLYLRTLNDLV